MRIDGKIWIKEAKNELETAELLLQNKKWSAAIFHSQQVVEKGVKGLLHLLDLSPWGHSSKKLLEEYYNHRKLEFSQDLLDCCARLDLAYIASRYPSFNNNVAPSDIFTETITQESYECAKKVFLFVLKEVDEL